MGGSARPSSVPFKGSFITVTEDLAIPPDQSAGTLTVNGWVYDSGAASHPLQVTNLPPLVFGDNTAASDYGSHRDFPARLPFTVTLTANTITTAIGGHDLSIYVNNAALDPVVALVIEAGNVAGHVTLQLVAGTIDSASADITSWLSLTDTPLTLSYDGTTAVCKVNGVTVVSLTATDPTRPPISAADKIIVVCQHGGSATKRWSCKNLAMTYLQEVVS